MDEDLARIMATASFRASKELTEIVLILKEYLPEDRELRVGVASAIAEIGMKVMQPAFDAHPQLEAEFKARMDRYGRST